MLPQQEYLFDIEDMITSFSEMRIEEETHEHKYCSEYKLHLGTIEDWKVDPRKKIFVHTNKKASGEVMI